MIFSVIEYGSVPEISGTELFYAQKKDRFTKKRSSFLKMIRLAAIRRIKPALSRWAIARSPHDPFVLQPRNANAFFQSAVGRSSILKRRLNP